MAPRPDSPPEGRVASIRVWVSEELIAGSPAMREVLRALERLQDAPLVLLQGETGTGKDLVARFLHDRATAGFQRLQALDPSALDADGLAAELDGLRSGVIGRTLVIREVAELSFELQLQVLRALDSVVGWNGRIVCSTQRDLEREVEARRFLPILWDRLRPVAVRLPPLRERRQDLPHLIQHFLQKLAAQYGRPPVHLTREAWQVLLSHRWEGNVRELRNEVERLVVFAPEDGPVGIAGLSAALHPASRSGPAVGRAASGLTGGSGRLRRRSSTAPSGRRWMHRERGWPAKKATFRAAGRHTELWPGRARRRSRCR